MLHKGPKTETLHRVFTEIVNGFSICIIEGKEYYIKHLSHEDQVILDLMYDEYLQEALQEGLESEENRRKYLIENSIWSEEFEKEVKDIKIHLNGLEKSKVQLSTKTNIEQRQKLINDQKKRLRSLQLQKNEVFGMTAEVAANDRLNDFYACYVLHSDKEMRKKIYELYEFDNLSESKATKILDAINQEMSKFSDEMVKYLCIEGFFQLYWSMCQDNPYYFYGIPSAKLTFYQVKLANYAPVFKHALSKQDSMPQNIKGNPDAMLDYIYALENDKKNLAKAANSKGTNKKGSSKESTKVIGASQDVVNEVVGKGAKSVNFIEKMKQDGKKSANANEFFKMVGMI